MRRVAAGLGVLLFALGLVSFTLTAISRAADQVEGRWAFDSTDRSASTGSIGALSLKGSPTSVGGVRGNALRLNGTTDFAVIPAPDESLRQAFTMSAFVRPSSTSQPWHAIVSRQRTLDTDHQFWFGVENQKLIAAVVTETGRAVATGPAVPVGRWTHVTARYSGLELVLFVDGLSVGRTSMSGRLVLSNRPMLLGANGNGPDETFAEEYFAGDIDELLVTNRVLSDAEVLTLSSQAGPLPKLAAQATVPTKKASSKTTKKASPKTTKRATAKTTKPKSTKPGKVTSVVPVLTVGAPVAVKEGTQSFVRIRLAQPAPGGELRVVPEVVSAGASLSPGGTGQDVDIAQTVFVAKGTKEVSLSVTARQDLVAELDEPFKVSLRSPESDVVLGSALVIISDDDTKRVVDVMSTGAACDGASDDSGAFQRAIDLATAAGRGVVVIPSGRKCVVRSVIVYPGITLQGFGATLVRPANVGNSRMFSTRTNGDGPWRSDVDSLPLVIRGLTLDGNSQNQGSYRNFELEQAHLIFVHANPASSGRVTFFAEDLLLVNGVADGISLYTNVSATLLRIRAVSLFRGGVTVTGGHTVASITDLKTETGFDLTGIDVEVDGEGFGKSFAVDLTLTDIALDGDLDIGLGRGSRVVIDRLVANGGPFTMVTPSSTVIFRNSRIVVGTPDSFVNRIVAPGDISFIDSTIRFSPNGGNRGSFYGIELAFQHPGYPNQPPARVRFERVIFEAEGVGTTPVFGVYERDKRPADIVEFVDVVGPPGKLTGP